MIIQMFTVGEYFTNCYVAACEKTKEAIIIDPAFESRNEAEKIFTFIKANSLTLKLIVNTHGHPDHISGNNSVKKIFNIPILIHECDASMLGEIGNRIAKFLGRECFSPAADVLLHEGDAIKFGMITLKVLHTPGHSSGGISLLGTKEIFTGDTLFSGSIGRMDFPGSSESDMRLSLKRLASLPENLVVYPGHGPITTIGQEKRSNPFLQEV